MCSEVVQCTGSSATHTGSGQVRGNKQKVRFCPIKQKRAGCDVVNGLGAALIRSLSSLQRCAFLPCRNLLLENLIVKDLFSGNPNELI